MVINLSLNSTYCQLLRSASYFSFLKLSRDLDTRSIQSSLKQRNALGAHSGSYSIYRVLSIALGFLPNQILLWQNLRPIPVTSSKQYSRLRMDVLQWRKRIRRWVSWVKSLGLPHRLNGSLADLDLDATAPPCPHTHSSLTYSTIKSSSILIVPFLVISSCGSLISIYSSESLLRLFEDTGGMYPELDESGFCFLLEILQSVTGTHKVICFIGLC